MAPRAILYALLSAALFGASTPLAKRLVGDVSPLVLAGLLYAGSGLGLATVLAAQRLRRGRRTALALPARGEWRWLAAAIVCGGVAGPVLLMYGLVATPASTASLLLNLEVVFTALLAWFVFRENVDRRIALGMLAIVAGGVLLAWTPGDQRVAGGSLLVAAACLCWAVDNNLTRRVSTADAVFIAAAKGLVGAIVNVTLALALGERLPGLSLVTVAGVVGLLGYGVSLVLFVVALRSLGAARAAAYFAVAPFFGAVVAVVAQGDPVDGRLLGAGALMAMGVWLHLTERHAHEHAHDWQEHVHAHVHDEHHRHAHDFPWDDRKPHTHQHVHAPMMHAHPHYPDIHHRHGHDDG